MSVEIKLSDRAFPVSPAFIEFLHHCLPGASRMCPCTISSARCWRRSMPKESARWRNRWPETEYVITLRHPVAAAISTYEKFTGLPA